MIRHGFRFCCSFLLFAIHAASLSAQANDLEYEVKAAFLYNFTRFVTWPDEAYTRAQSPVVIGVLGPNPFGDALENAVRGKTVDDRPLAVRYGDDLSELGELHVLFISRSEVARVPQILEQLEGRPVLTVSELPHFTAQGGMVRFYVRERRVAFEINPAAADRAGLRISSRLLSVATVYREAGASSR